MAEIVSWIPTGEKIPPNKKNLFGRRPMRWFDGTPCIICWEKITESDTAVRVRNHYLPGAHPLAHDRCAKEPTNA